MRYWAAARCAAGVDADSFPWPTERRSPRSCARILELRADRPKLHDVVGVCSVLLGDRPVGAAEPEDVSVRPGDTVELLPPFAGG